MEVDYIAPATSIGGFEKREEVPENILFTNRTCNLKKQIMHQNKSNSEDVMVSNHPSGSMTNSNCCANINLDLLYPGRQTEINMLKTMYSFDQDFQFQKSWPANVHLWGTPSIGKTAIFTSMLQKYSVNHAFTNCSLKSTPNALFTDIIQQFDGSYEDKIVSGAEEFVDVLKNIIKKRSTTSTTTTIGPNNNNPCGGFVLVVKNPEQWVPKHFDSFDILCSISKIVDFNISVVTISHQPWDYFNSSICNLLPIKIFFPPYSKADIMDILCSRLQEKDDRSTNFFKQFIDLIWGVFYQVSRDLNEIRHLAALLYPIYKWPVESGKIDMSDRHRLWKHIDPYFQSIMPRIYLREISSSQWLDIVQQLEKGDHQKIQDEGTSEILTSLQQHSSSSRKAMLAKIESMAESFDTHINQELPYYSKLLLVSSFLASHNPANSDKGFFVKMQAKSRQKAKATSKKFTSHHLSGPKTFPLDRMLAIFYSLVDDHLNDSSLISFQVGTLENIGLLTKVSRADTLDVIKYRCNVHETYIRKLSKSIGIDLDTYLYTY